MPAQHLAQVTHRRFTCIALPARVRDEADRGVERGVRSDVGEMLRIQWQQGLAALQQVQGEHTDQIEQQQGHCVGLPVHLVAGVDARQAVDASLERRGDARQTGRPALHGARHVCAERLDQGEQDGEEQPNLNDGLSKHRVPPGEMRGSCAAAVYDISYLGARVRRVLLRHRQSGAAHATSA